jgi:single-strand DNA-binding protein
MSNPIVTITGRIGTDPEIKSFGDGNVMRFRLITSDRRKNDAGVWEDKDTSGWTIKAWNTLVDQSRDTLKKGQEITVVGSMKEDVWTDKEGNKRTSYEIKASNISVSVFSLKKESSTTADDFPSYKTYAEVPF